jgi:DNA repair protein RadA/Sms
VYIGELGLNGDIRPVNQLDRRIDEALKLGFTSVYLPQFDGFHLKRAKKDEIHYLKNISDLIINGKTQPEEQIP